MIMMEAKLFVFLALVAFFVANCHAVDESEYKQFIDVTINDRLMEVPVYADPQFTKEKRDSVAERFGSNKAKLLKFARLIIVERNDLSASKNLMSLFGSYLDFLRAGLGSPKRDISPLVKAILNSHDSLSGLSDNAIYTRVKTFMDGTEALIRKTPVGTYPDWNKLTLDNRAISLYLAPVIYWSRHNGFSVLVSSLGVAKRAVNKFDKLLPRKN